MEETRTTEESPWKLDLGASVISPEAVRFRVWAPRARSVELKILGPRPATLRLDRGPEDVYQAEAPGVSAGADYFYLLDNERTRPDPVSRWQPRGVHGPSRVVDPAAFAWTDAGWNPIALGRYVLYELHVGTFSPEGTFEAVIPRLRELRELGVTAVELMPVGEFPGARNWGYDNVDLYAPHSAYGGPEGLKRLVDACHREGLAVVLDVVYNHLGPEGNYLGEFAAYFTSRYRTPWGDAINFDGPDSDGVRRFFLQNALYWITEYHVDALRLDAIHGIFDFSARHILREMADAVHRQAAALGRRCHLIAESDLNDVRVIEPVELGGYGVDAQWSDDFHHSLHALLTGDRRGYFADFGSMDDLRKALVEGFVYDGRRSEFRRRRHGNSAAGRSGEQFVICIQNHDQVANGSGGQRLAGMVSLAEQKLAAALLLCAPNLPLLFMGQEYGETAPFLYFTSHTDPELGEAVRRGRAEEFRSFEWEGEFDDPQAEETFLRSRLDWGLRDRQPQAGIRALYRDLLALRSERACLGNGRRDLMRVACGAKERWLRIERGEPAGPGALCVFNLERAPLRVPLVGNDRRWKLALFTGDCRYGDSPGEAPPASLGAREEGVPLAASSAAVYLEHRTG